MVFIFSLLTLSADLLVYIFYSMDRRPKVVFSYNLESEIVFFLYECDFVFLLCRTTEMSDQG